MESFTPPTGTSFSKNSYETNKAQQLARHKTTAISQNRQVSGLPSVPAGFNIQRRVFRTPFAICHADQKLSRHLKGKVRGAPTQKRGLVKRQASSNGPFFYVCGAEPFLVPKGVPCEGKGLFFGFEFFNNSHLLTVAQAWRWNAQPKGKLRVAFDISVFTTCRIGIFTIGYQIASGGYWYFYNCCIFTLTRLQ